jgi:hypothetical protein
MRIKSSKVEVKPVPGIGYRRRVHKHTIGAGIVAVGDA